MKNLLFTVSLILLYLSKGLAQEMTQTIRGTITDLDSQTPLIGASVQIMGSDPIIGSTTNIEGEFRIESVPVGRITLKVNYVGFEEKIMPNLLLNSAKEIVLHIPLVESIEKMNEIVVTAKQNKAEVLNEMSVVSARSFSVEETQRYAGSFADPARMVSAFAGVANPGEGNNDIIVRGNSPKGILWRLEGIEIPNPNHFADEGATGGPINALNSNMLSDSDFMSGAFAPEYGNALSGVFDMKLKTGNNERREYTVGASTLGLDVTAEGPFKTGYNGSYLANYRYSSLALIDNLGIMDFGGIPKYQDVSFNIKLPIDQSNHISIFGLGGKSSIADELTSDIDSEVLSKSTFRADMGVVGLNHNLLINDKSFIRTSLSAAGTQLEGTQDVPDNEGDFNTISDAMFTKSFIKINSTFNHKFNARHKLEAGVVYTKLGYNLIDNSWNDKTEQTETILNDKDHSYTLQTFTTWKYRLNTQITFTGGAHFLQFGLNNSYSVEPRAALKWTPNSKSAFTLGFGLHSRLESMSIYLGKQSQPDGSVLTPNKDLEMSKSAHYVIGYNRALGANTHLKLETYYQYLYDVPIEDAIGSTYSQLNETQDYSNKTLVNKGTGRNYGIELTLERYLNRGVYYMTSASLYESLYTPKDGIERKTTFSGNYIFNILGGKEWKVGHSKKDKVVFVNTKVSLIGGNRYTPIDLAASKEAGYEIRMTERPFSVKADDIFIVNFSIGTRRNKNNTSSEFKIDIQNASNNKAVIGQDYEQRKERISQYEQLPFFPTISYAFSF